MKCNECIFLPSETIWESKSKIEGELGQKSPFRNDNILYQSPGFQGQNEEHPISGITKQKCQNCSDCHLIAYEAFFKNNKIIFENIDSRKVRLKKTVEDNSSESFSTRPNIRHRMPYHMGKSREKYNFYDEPEEVKDAALSLLKRLFSVPGFLSPQQAEIFAKVNLGFKLRKSTERNTKMQLKNKLRSLEYIVDYWEDLEDLL